MTELTRKVADRDEPVNCHNCRWHPFRVGQAVGYVEMVRQVTAPCGFKGLEVNH